MLMPRLRTRSPTPSGEAVRRYRKVILNEGQAIEDLDLWPGDEVLLHDSFILLGKVNASGEFVSRIDEETVN